jgi:uncharacterized protein with PIN domain
MGEAMNERIKQIREQALRWSGENVNRNLYSKYEIEQKEYEKFAELIVRECAKFFDDNSGCDECNNCFWPEPKELLEHFGVEP